MRVVVAQSLNVAEIETATYSLIIATTGFESRARHIVDVWKPKARMKWAPAFDDRTTLAFPENRRLLKAAGYDVTPVSDELFHARAEEMLAQAILTSDGPVRVLVDVSSMTRSRIAKICDAARLSASRADIRVDFVYTPAVYVDPPSSSPQIIEYGPVTAAYAGWTSDPMRQLTAIFGVGYEQDQVIGVVEALEPAEVWCFLPDGPDSRYLRSIHVSNETLWDEVAPDRRVVYDVMAPITAIENLESLVYGVLRERRCVLIPFGPKIFAVTCLLVAAMHHPHVSVWRVSSGSLEDPVDRVGTEFLTGVSANFRVPRPAE